MKDLVFIAVILFCVFSANAQDIIYRKNGQTIKCKIISTDTSSIYYQEEDNNKIPNSSIQKSKVSKLVFGINERAEKQTIVYIKSNSEPENSIKPSEFIEDTLSVLKPIKKTDIRPTALSFGFLHGGGALFGADLEFMLGKYIGIQAGAGLSAVGAGFNFHFKDNIRSSFVSMQYWRQGFGFNFQQSLIGPIMVIRAKKLFTASIGLGFVLDKGNQTITKPGSTILTYAVGIYIPYEN